MLNIIFNRLHYLNKQTNKQTNEQQIMSLDAFTQAECWHYIDMASPLTHGQGQAQFITSRAEV